jgi:ketosteroid isomerase-like protein
MSIELHVGDEEMMDLTDGLDQEDQPTAEPVQQEENQTVADHPADDLVLKVKQVKQFYGIPEDLDASKKWHDDIRLNVVHVHGVQDMGSEDVLAYFKAFDPSSLEWVNDKSCEFMPTLSD